MRIVTAGAVLMMALAAVGCDMASNASPTGSEGGGPQLVGTPTNFHTTACHASGGWVRYDVAWSDRSSGDYFDIAEQTSATSTPTNIVYSGGPDVTAFQMDGHQSGTYYYYLRLNDGTNYSDWVGLTTNPLGYSHC